ncbi:hypothetical protein BU204_22110 [Actinophytocola xanthii]|uniref:WXG100 family type VII secretion target n=1 Tax=Actinophytocola xanthii TaxID=1912961 RepID=A0A1Q8CLU9_9PSEU|nr:hypothetical protein BU204_22110 [Actinophytocola xanthii]
MQPGALRQLAAQVDRAREDVVAARTHLAKIQEFQGGEGVVGRLTGGHRDVYNALDSWLGELAHPTLSSVAQAVRDSAAYYERTDQTSAQRLDAAYPAADAAEQRKQTGYISGPGAPAEFQDVQEPRGRLSKIKDYREELNGDYDWWDAFSPMTAIGAALEAVSHVAVWLQALDRPIDPWDEIVKPWVGDWAGLRAAADVLNDVRWALNDVGINIQWASQGCQAVWRGNAGDGAAVYLMRLVTPFEQAHEQLREIVDQYRLASEEMVRMRDAVVNILKGVGDAAIEAAGSAWVAGGAAATGVGAPIAVFAGALSAYNVYRVVDGIKEMFGLIGQMDTVIKVVEAAQTNYGSVHHAGTGLPSLPTAPLDPPK